MAGYEDGELGFEEGMSWLPSQVLDEAFSDDTNSYNKVLYGLILAYYIFFLQFLHLNICTQRPTLSAVVY